jgi:hypothetical protein
MIIVGQVSSKAEAQLIENITMNFLIGKKARLLASQL